MNRFTSRNGVGAASVLLIIVVVCMTIFTVLTFLSARSDLKLTQRSIETTQAYYHADQAAQVLLQQADEAILQAGDPGDIPGITPLEDAPTRFQFLSSTGDGRAIRVVFELTDTPGKRYEILEYRLVSTDAWGDVHS